MNVARGLGIAFAAFAGSFVLHIIGGASGQDWLFGIAVALIFVTATGFPTLAMWFAGFRDGRSTGGRIALGGGALAGYVFTVAALWAANGRAFAWWEFPLGVALLLAVSGLLFKLGQLWLIFRGKDQPPRVPRAARPQMVADTDPPGEARG